MVLIGAAVAIPNLLRARMAANEASVAGSLRTINTAQITYSAMYPQTTYAPDLASLGTDPQNAKTSTAHHAALIDTAYTAPACVSGQWCLSSGYRFTLSAVCKLRACKEYVAIATPDSTNTGTKNFCSTSDTVIHIQVGAPLTQPITPAECKRWPPLQ
jgi:type II secretory pathway pseudopilin PulG